MNIDEAYMSRCIQLAKLGRYNVGTNPMVGCVIVHNGRIIGEGYHQKFGEAHAEVNAIKSVNTRDARLLPESTLYVNLEPCCHTGKTPPCTKLIMAKRIKRVVVGMKDPNVKVDGEGIITLRLSGIEVEEGVLEEECRDLNRRYSVYQEKERPYVIIKWAQTIDGYIDNDREVVTPPTWMTGERCKTLAHKWRSEEDAVMVGSNTVRRDNPQLTVREYYGRSPIRVTIDRRRQINRQSYIFDKSANTIIFTHKEAEGTIINAPSYMSKYIQMNFDKSTWIKDILHDLYLEGVTSVLVEGGAYIIRALLENDLVDESRVFVAPLRLNDLAGGKKMGEGVKAPFISKRPYTREQTTIDNVLLSVSTYTLY